MLSKWSLLNRFRHMVIERKSNFCCCGQPQMEISEDFDLSESKARNLLGLPNAWKTSVGF